METKNYEEIIEIDNENEGGDGETTTIPATPLEPSIPSQNERPSIPLIPADPALSPEEEIAKREDEINKLLELIGLNSARIKELKKDLYLDDVKETIKESNHYYDGDKKLYVFRKPEQETLRTKLLTYDPFLSDSTLEELLAFYDIHYEFYGREEILYISLDPLCLCGKGEG